MKIKWQKQQIQKKLNEKSVEANKKIVVRIFLIPYKYLAKMMGFFFFWKNCIQKVNKYEQIKKNPRIFFRNSIISTTLNSLAFNGR